MDRLKLYITTYSNKYEQNQQNSKQWEEEQG